MTHENPSAVGESTQIFQGDPHTQIDATRPEEPRQMMTHQEFAQARAEVQRIKGNVNELLIGKAVEYGGKLWVCSEVTYGIVLRLEDPTGRNGGIDVPMDLVNDSSVPPAIQPKDTDVLR